MSVEWTIAEVLHRLDCGCDQWKAEDHDGFYYRQAVGVVNAIGGMDVHDKAELIGGVVERSDTCAECAERGVDCDRSARAVGPWGAP